MRAAVSYCEPWQGQKYPPNSPRFSFEFIPSGTHPKCVQTPMVINQLLFPGLVRASSVCGSRSNESGTATASAISFAVSCRTKSGCEWKIALMPWPGTICDRSTSVELSASTSADGAIWLISGTSVARAPTPAKLTAAMLMKSRRSTFGSIARAGFWLSFLDDIAGPSLMFGCRPSAKLLRAPTIGSDSTQILSGGIQRPRACETEPKLGPCGIAPKPLSCLGNRRKVGQRIGADRHPATSFISVTFQYYVSFSGRAPLLCRPTPVGRSGPVSHFATMAGELRITKLCPADSVADRPIA
jgi:hypothetical protein